LMDAGLPYHEMNHIYSTIVSEPVIIWRVFGGPQI
jgi:hypothetical protein